MKKLLAVVLAIALMMCLFTACAKPAEQAQTEPAESAEPASTTAAETPAAAETEKSEGFKIGLAIEATALPFYSTIASVVKEGVDAKGDTLIAVDAGGDLQTQLDQVEDLLAQDIDILLLCPRDRTAVLPALKACQEAGVPVISWDKLPNDTEYLTSHVASDNYDCGRVIGEYIAKDLPTGSKMLVLGIPAAESICSRIQGMKDAVAAAGVEYEYIDVDMSTDTEALQKVEDALQANPDLNAAYGPYEALSLAAAAGVTSAGMDVKVYGVDASPSEKEAIAAGQIVATAVQSPYKIGTQLVATLYDVLNGKPVEAQYLIPSFVIDASNLAEYGTDDWQ